MEFEKEITNDFEKTRKSQNKDARKGASIGDSYPEIGLDEKNDLEDSNEVLTKHIDEGSEIDRFAAARNLSNEEVWRQIRSGKLLGRLVSGKVLVFESEKSAKLHSETSPFNFSDLPPFPGDMMMSMPGNQPAKTESTHSPEIALLIDHLSIAKEENREIIRLTQDALQKMEDLNKQIISMKDDSILERDEKIERLAAELKAQNEKILKLQRDKEDLETLTKTIG